MTTNLIATTTRRPMPASLRPYRGRLSSFDPLDNGITSVRLALALTVVVSHSIGLGGFGLEPLVAETQMISIGFIAVLAFFALSGFLLARSRELTPVVAFLRNRALRILPAYWAALLFAAFVAAPIGCALAGVAFQPGEALGYVVSNVGLIVTGGQLTVLPAFDGHQINQALWTLRIEAFGYLFLAFLPIRWLRPVAPAEFCLLLALWVASPNHRGDELALLTAFTFGVVAWQWKSWLPMSMAAMAIAVVIAWVAALAGALPIVAIAVGYAALGLAWSPFRLERDHSYGVYVFAYPIQLALVAAGITSLAVMLIASITIVLAIAFMSWTLIERPALSLRHHGRLVVGRGFEGMPPAEPLVARQSAP